MRRILQGMGAEVIVNARVAADPALLEPIVKLTISCPDEVATLPSATLV